MPATCETSDRAILDLLRQSGPLGISQLTRATRVTPTAVRQRLARLMAQGLVERELAPATRGRPSHCYRLTAKGERQAGDNFGDLALVLWDEVRSIADPQVRRGLLQRVAQKMARMYAGRVQGRTTRERMNEVAEVFAERQLPFVVEEPAVTTDGARTSGISAPSAVAENTVVAENTALPVEKGLPVLIALACPYPQLAEQDRGICALERMMVAELLECDVKLAACRLDGDSCCRFQTN